MCSNRAQGITVSKIPSKVAAEEAASSPSPSRLLPLKEACKRFGNISRATAYRGARDGRFPPIRAAMGRAAVREDELEKFIMNAPVAGRKLG